MSTHCLSPDLSHRHTYALFTQYIWLTILVANILYWVGSRIFRALITVSKGLLDLDVCYMILYCYIFPKRALKTYPSSSGEETENVILQTGGINTGSHIMYLHSGRKMNFWGNTDISMLPHTLACAFHSITGFNSHLKESTVPLSYNCK